MQENYIDAEISRIGSKIQQIRMMLSNDDATANIIEALEGEGEAALDVLWQEIQENEMLLIGLGEHIKNAQDRKSRIEGRVETLRTVMTYYLKRTNKDKVVRPCYTASLRDTPPKMIIEDESKIPSEFFKAQEPVLNKKELKECLEVGQVIEGACLTEKGFSITIRNK